MKSVSKASYEKFVKKEFVVGALQRKDMSALLYCGYGKLIRHDNMKKADLEKQLTEAIAEHGLEKLEPLVKMIPIEPDETVNDATMENDGDQVELEEDEIDGLIIESATSEQEFPDVDHVDGFAIEASIEEVGGMPFSEV